ncbi:phage virion morphogenesis protein [Thermomonas sp. S9]|nr:phage virion morphogenesis protein [Thermomonas sp. S9]
MTPAMREIAMELEARALNRFETERDPAGRPWQPLSPVTLARKKGRGGILYQTGDLLDSATSRAGRDVAEVGFGLRYAVFHEYGTKKMPRRGLLMADPEARTLGEDDKRAILRSSASTFPAAETQTRRGAICLSPRLAGWTSRRARWCWRPSGHSWPTPDRQPRRTRCARISCAAATNVPPGSTKTRQRPFKRTSNAVTGWRHGRPLPMAHVA